MCQAESAALCPQPAVPSHLLWKGQMKSWLCVLMLLLVEPGELECSTGLVPTVYLTFFFFSNLNPGLCFKGGWRDLWIFLIFCFHKLCKNSTKGHLAQSCLRHKKKEPFIIRTTSQQVPVLCICCLGNSLLPLLWISGKWVNLWQYFLLGTFIPYNNRTPSSALLSSMYVGSGELCALLAFHQCFWGYLALD